MTEADIENEFVSFAESRGCMVEKLVRQGRKGWPDRSIYAPNGWHFLIEFKKPGGTTSPHQDRAIEGLERRGHEVYVYDNIPDATDKLREVLLRPTRPLWRS